MSEEWKKRLDQAILKNAQKHLPKEPRRKQTKRKAPEKAVEKEVLAWCRKYKFSVDVVSNEAVQKAMRGGADKYGDSSPTRPGFPDIVGNDRWGRAVFIELKAKGRRKNLSYNQAVFLEEKIASNTFAVVVDSVDILQELYGAWHVILKDKGSLEAQKYLSSQLPKTSEQALRGSEQPENPDIPF